VAKKTSEKENAHADTEAKKFADASAKYQAEVMQSPKAINQALKETRSKKA
jgi:hypothetical protein